MPTYCYLCEIHNIEFEEFHSIKIDLEECLICKEKGLEQHKPKKLISGGSGRGIVELTGHELMQKTKEDAQKFKKEVHSSEQLYDNVLGGNKYHDLQSKIDRRKK